MSERPLAQLIASRALDPTLNITDSVRSKLQHVTTDAYGLMIAARREPYVTAIVDSILDPSESYAFGHSGGFSALDACLINGTAIHGEDFDDTFEGTPVHVSSIIIPVMLVLGQRTSITHESWLRAMAVGSELICRLALVAPTAVHRQGFHPTAVLGAFGAALSASVAMQLSVVQTANALGIVGSMASGIIEYLAEGTWTKRMHPGWAASAGVRAAAMAKQGFQGPHTVFEGTHGVFKAFAATDIPRDFSHLTTFAETWVCNDLAFKPYACGTMTQPFVDCAIRASQSIPENQVTRITAHVGEGTVHRLWEPLAEKRNPSTPYGAKFSVPYCIAVGWLDKQAGLSAFTEARRQQNDIQRLTSRIEYVINPNDPYPADYIGHIEVTLTDGSTQTFTQSCLRGGKRQPMSSEEIHAKCRLNLAYGGMSESQIESAMLTIADLFQDKNNIRECIHKLGQLGEHTL